MVTHRAIMCRSEGPARGTPQLSNAGVASEFGPATLSSHYHNSHAHTKERCGNTNNRLGGMSDGRAYAHLPLQYPQPELYRWSPRGHLSHRTTKPPPNPPQSLYPPQAQAPTWLERPPTGWCQHRPSELGSAGRSSVRRSLCTASPILTVCISTTPQIPVCCPGLSAGSMLRDHPGDNNPSAS